MFGWLKTAASAGLGKVIFKFVDVASLVKLGVGAILDLYRSKGHDALARWVVMLGQRLFPLTATPAELNELTVAFEAVFFTKKEGSSKLEFSQPWVRLGKAYVDCIKK